MWDSEHIFGEIEKSASEARAEARINNENETIQIVVEHK